MDTDGESTKNNKKQGKKIGVIQRYVSNVSDVLSPIWVRCCTIYVNVYNRKHLESQYYYVFYIGSIFYFLFFIAKTCK